VALPVDRYCWQQAICGKDGPQSSTARLLLLALSLHMDADGMNAWPSQATLARRALVSRRSVVTHLEAAERDGWVTRYAAGRNGKGWRLDGYEATVPDAVYAALPQRPWESDPTWRRGERAAPPYAHQGSERVAPPSSTSSSTTNAIVAEGGANGARDVVQLTTEGGATGAERGERGAHESSLPNLPYESSLRGEGALTRTASPKRGCAKAEEEDRRGKILLLTTKGYDAHDIAKLLSGSGVTVEEVQRVRLGVSQ
jgi:hypothetical protein